MIESAKVLLIHPPTDKPYPISILPPLGILYIAAYLRDHDTDVHVIDLNISKSWEDDLQSALTEFKPTHVGLSSNISSYNTALKVASMIKERKGDIITIIGGPHPTTDPDAYRSPSIDYLIPNEAEKVMLDFIRSNKDQRLYKADDNGSHTRILKNDQFTNVDLNMLPFPAYDLVPIEKYHVNSYRRRPLVSIITSRGCPAKCIFCNQEVSGHAWRARSAENVVAEMEWLEKEIGVKEVSICDDNFTVDVKRVYDICDLKKSKGNKLVWQLANGVRVDKLTKDLLRAMKEAGCWKLAIAPEVGDKESFIKLRKGGTLDKYRQVAQWCKELDIVYFGFFMVGFPFQTEEQVQQTVDFAMELDPLLMDMSKIVAFKGTELYNQYPVLRDGNKNNNSNYYEKRGDDYIEKLHKEAHYRFYSRPKKIFEIIRKIGLRSFIRFVRYGVEVFYTSS